MLVKSTGIAGVVSTLFSIALNTANAAIQRHEVTLDNVHDYRRRLSAAGVIESEHIKHIDRTNEEYAIQAEGETEYLTETQFRNEYIEGLPSLELALKCETQMSRLACEPDSCDAELAECHRCSATYCLTNLGLVAENPQLYPSFMYVTDTDHCRVQSSSFGLNALYDEAMAADAAAGATTRSLSLDLGVFEMGFTESDRLTRPLSADPETLFHVNPQPIYEAMMQCLDKRKGQLAKKTCDEEKVIGMVRKVAYLMCRTDDPVHKRCAMKFWSDASLALEVFELAFPDADIEYVYRDPEEYMGAAIFDPNRTVRASCAKQKRNPSKTMIAAAEEAGVKIEDLSIEELCALEARSVIGAAIKSNSKRGRVNFILADDIPNRLDEIADRFYKTTGVGIPAHAKDKALDVMYMDTRGNKDPDKFANGKNKKKGNASAKGKEAKSLFLDDKDGELKNLDKNNNGKN